MSATCYMSERNTHNKNLCFRDKHKTICLKTHTYTMIILTKVGAIMKSSDGNIYRRTHIPWIHDHFKHCWGPIRNQVMEIFFLRLFVYRLCFEWLLASSAEIVFTGRASKVYAATASKRETLMTCGTHWNTSTVDIILSFHKCIKQCRLSKGVRLACTHTHSHTHTLTHTQTHARTHTYSPTHTLRHTRTHTHLCRFPVDELRVLPPVWRDRYPVSTVRIPHSSTRHAHSATVTQHK